MLGIFDTEKNTQCLRAAVSSTLRVLEEAAMNKQTVSISILLMLALMTLTACTSPLSAPGTTVGATVNLPEQAPVAPTTPVPAPLAGTSGTGASGDLLAAYQGTLETLYGAVSPSVVNIRVVQKAAAQDPSGSVLPGFPFFNMPQGHPPVQQFQTALGSGFVWDAQGHIVTNNHVVSGADKDRSDVQ